jgi:hypothetical protein
MNTAKTSAAGAAATATATGPTPDWIEAQAERARRTTEAAVKKLGVGDEVAREVANGGGLLYEGWIATITLLPMPSAQDPNAAPLLVTLDTNRPFGEVPPQELAALLTLAPTLLANGVAMGASMRGTLCLQRVVAPAESDAQGLEQALRNTWHLARLLWQDEGTDTEVQ